MPWWCSPDRDESSIREVCQGTNYHTALSQTLALANARQVFGSQCTQVGSYFVSPTMYGSNVADKQCPNGLEKGGDPGSNASYTRRQVTSLVTFP